VQASADGAARRRWWTIAAVVAVLLIANALVAWNLLATHGATANAEAAQSQTATTLATRRGDLANLRHKQAQATSTLNNKTNERNNLTAREKAAKARTGARKAAIAKAFAQINATHGHMISLHECLLKVQAALNTLGGGDLTNGSIALADVQRLCEAT
jgi:hypothetical protein